MNSINFKLPLNGVNSSKGESHIENVLQKVTDELNTFYSREVRIGYFAGKRRRADFSFNYNGRTFIIEFDGIQHSKPIDNFGGEETFKETKKRDHWENMVFCPNNNICLIRYKVFCHSNNEEEEHQAQNRLLSFITPQRLKEDIKKALNCKYVQNSVSYGRKRLRIAADLDGTLLDWATAHENYYHEKLSDVPDYKITRQVTKLRHNKDFWSNLELLERPDFIPHIYCTKRVNSKVYTRNNLKKHNLPIRPIYQIGNQEANKAHYIKGKADILIDDSWFNVKQCLDAGFPALLITREYNKHIQTPYRINHLKYQEITKKYYELFR